MLTIKRTIVLLILFAIVFFIYRGINPLGADNLLIMIKNFPIRMWILSWELTPLASRSREVVSSPSFSGGDLFSGKSLVFSSTLVTWWFLSLEALVIPVEKTTILPKSMTTWWSLIIIQTPTEIKTPVVVKKPTVVPVVVTKKPSSIITNQDYALLNNLFK